MNGVKGNGKGNDGSTQMQREIVFMLRKERLVDDGLGLVLGGRQVNLLRWPATGGHVVR